MEIRLDSAMLCTLCLTDCVRGCRHIARSLPNQSPVALPHFKCSATRWRDSSAPHFFIRRAYKSARARPRARARSYGPRYRPVRPAWQADAGCIERRRCLAGPGRRAVLQLSRVFFLARPTATLSGWASGTEKGCSAGYV